MESKYTLLGQSDSETTLSSLPSDTKPRGRASTTSIILTVLVVAVNIACIAATWKQMGVTQHALGSRLDFRDTRDLPRPNTDSYFGEY